jgi:hypothetical protein
MGVKRFCGYKRPPFGGRIMGVPADFRNQSLGREAGRLFNSGPDNGPKRKNGVVNRHEVNQVAHLAPPDGCHHLVNGEVSRVQNIAESLVPHRREKAKVAVNDPFEASAAILPRNFSGIDQGKLPQPPNTITGRFEYLRIVSSGRHHSFLAVVKNVNVAGIAGRVPVQGCCARDITFRIAV